MPFVCLYCSSTEGQLFCPRLTEAVLNQIGSEESLNINEDRETKRIVVARSLEKSLMTLFLHHYGWHQLGDSLSLNPHKTWRSMRSGLRMIYDAYMEALLQSSICRKWLKHILCWVMRHLDAHTHFGTHLHSLAHTCIPNYSYVKAIIKGLATVWPLVSFSFHIYLV